jgi:hypothetical protein
MTDSQKFLYTDRELRGFAPPDKFAIFKENRQEIVIFPAVAE